MTRRVTGRGQPVATLSPVDMTGQSIDARLNQLRAEGVVTGTGKPLSRMHEPVVIRGRPLSETIIEDREDRF
ncbi:MAG: hypothetical protein F4X11_20460 [Acidobacteria bacterium]|nr:hypothetical protein [Acidobacteriota bacterium]